MSACSSKGSATSSSTPTARPSGPSTIAPFSSRTRGRRRRAGESAAGHLRDAAVERNAHQDGDALAGTVLLNTCVANAVAVEDHTHRQAQFVQRFGERYLALQSIERIEIQRNGGAVLYGNGAVGGAAGENDVDGGKTTLFSPVYDLSSYDDVTIRYWKWYSNDRGNAPGQDFWDVNVSNDGGQSWTASGTGLDGANVERASIPAPAAA